MRPIIGCVRYLAYIAAGCGALGCHNVDDLSVSSGIAALVAPDTGTADGASLTSVLVTVDTSIPSSQWAATLNASAGVFMPGGKPSVTVTPDSTGNATVFLQAPRDSSAVLLSVSASGSAEVITHIITYRRAQAQTIQVFPAAFSVQAGVTHSLAVSAHLLRAIGLPSPRLGVAFIALDSNGTARGRFSAAAPSDSSGTVSVAFTSADTVFHGSVTIRARATLDTTVAGQAVVVITP